jgi:hypothetical protein
LNYYSKEVKNNTKYQKKSFLSFLNKENNDLINKFTICMDRLYMDPYFHNRNYDIKVIINEDVIENLKLNQEYYKGIDRLQETAIIKWDKWDVQFFNDGYNFNWNYMNELHYNSLFNMINYMDFSLNFNDSLKKWKNNKFRAILELCCFNDDDREINLKNLDFFIKDKKRLNIVYFIYILKTIAIVGRPTIVLLFKDNLYIMEKNGYFSPFFFCIDKGKINYVEMTYDNLKKYKIGDYDELLRNDINIDLY